MPRFYFEVLIAAGSRAGGLDNLEPFIAPFYDSLTTYYFPCWFYDKKYMYIAEYILLTFHLFKEDQGFGR